MALERSRTPEMQTRAPFLRSTPTPVHESCVPKGSSAAPASENLVRFDKIHHKSGISRFGQRPFLSAIYHIGELIWSVQTFAQKSYF